MRTATKMADHGKSVAVPRAASNTWWCYMSRSWAEGQKSISPRAKTTWDRSPSAMGNKLILPVLHKITRTKPPMPLIAPSVENQAVPKPCSRAAAWQAAQLSRRQLRQQRRTAAASMVEMYSGSLLGAPWLPCEMLVCLWGWWTTCEAVSAVTQPTRRSDCDTAGLCQWPLLFVFLKGLNKQETGSKQNLGPSPFLSWLFHDGFLPRARASRGKRRRLAATSSGKRGCVPGFDIGARPLRQLSPQHPRPSPPRVGTPGHRWELEEVCLPRDAGMPCYSWEPAPQEGAFPKARTPRTPPKPLPAEGNLVPLATCHEHNNNLGEARRLRSREPRCKLRSSEAPLVVLMRGRQEIVSFTPCPRPPFDGWARLPGGGFQNASRARTCLTAFL